MKRAFLVCLVAVATLISEAAEPIWERNVPYRSGADLDAHARERCVLDVHRPSAPAAPVPVLVYFHGGGLTGGEKYVPEPFQNRELCVVAPSYRLTPKARAQDCLEDAAAAVAWVFANLERLGGDGDLVILSGMSAGAYLDLMLGLDKRWLGAHGLDPARLAGLIPLSPQTITHMAFRKERGLPPQQPAVDEFAPLFHVRGDAPPILVVTGDRELELWGRYDEVAYFVRMMRLNGQKDIRHFELQGFDHGGMETPALPLVLREVERLVALRKPAKVP